VVVPASGVVLVLQDRAVDVARLAVTVIVPFVLRAVLRLRALVGGARRAPQRIDDRCGDGLGLELSRVERGADLDAALDRERQAGDGRQRRLRDGGRSLLRGRRYVGSLVFASGSDGVHGLSSAIPECGG
jgi:hypothetical protein